MTHHGMNILTFDCGRGWRLKLKQQLVAVVLLMGMLPCAPASPAAEYLLSDQSSPSLEIGQRLAPQPPNPPGPDTITFDQFVGEPIARSILKPVPEQSALTDWSTEQSSVALIGDDAEGQSAWVESSKEGSNQNSVSPDQEWEWTSGFIDGVKVQQYGDWCKQCFGQRNACWTGRVDAIVMWRNAPYSRDLVTEQGELVLNAEQLESSLAAGPRIQLFRTNSDGAAVEVGYVRAFNFRSERFVSAATVPLRPVDILPPAPNPFFDDGTVNLGSSLQTLELNGRVPLRQGNLQFISGFRWLEWNESFSLDTSVPTAPGFFDNYATNVINSLYGGQIGIDALLYTNTWIEVESVLKGGAYYNSAVSRSAFISNSSPDQNWSVSEQPASGAFVGEIGFTGVVSITSCLDLRFGYLGYWLQSIAQPTRQLSNPAALVANGGTVVQGVTLGLEGRW